MRAVIVTGSGGADVLQVQEVAAPEIKRDSQIRVRLKAAGVNPIDVKIRQAVDRFPLQLPAILGCDGAGVVDAVGAAVTAFKPGDEVYYCQAGLGERQGNYAQYAVVEQSLVAHKPKSLSFIEAAAAPLVLITAWESLHDRLGLTAGQSVLIHAGAGGVGHVAIQLAKLAGAKVATTVSTPQKGELAAQLGADKVIFYLNEDVAQAVADWTDGQGADSAFDTVGGAVFQQCFACVRYYGDMVSILQPPAQVDWSQARLRNLRISLEMMLTPVMLDLPEGQRHQGEILKQCAALFDQGKLSIHVAQSFPLTEAAQAHECLESESPSGKLVLEID